MPETLVLRSHLVPIFLGRAARLGVEVGDLCQRFHVANDTSAPVVTIGLAAFRDLSDELAQRTSDPLFGFHAALEGKRGSYGVLEYVVRNAPTVRAVLERLAQYGRVINAQVRIAFDQRTGRISENIPGVVECLGKHGNDFAVAYKVRVGRELVGPAFIPKRVFFAHAPSSADQELRDFLRGSELVFRAGFNGLELSSDVLDLPIPTADPALLDVLEERAQEITRSMEAAGDLDFLRRAVAEEIATSGTATMLARRLGMSQRTLHRRLADAGVTLRDLVDGVRREMAVEYLDDPGRPIGEIAERLGYSDARAFARAFRRWTGQTPVDYRRGPKPSDDASRQ